MKIILSHLLTAAAVFTLTATLHSQAPGASKTPLQLAQALKAKNQELIEKQKQTLEKLDDLDKQAAQLKIFGKRS
jgi:Spy/CpxP family protein refolding chaperone